MSDVLNKATVLVLNRNWQAIEKWAKELTLKLG